MSSSSRTTPASGPRRSSRPRSVARTKATLRPSGSPSSQGCCSAGADRLSFGDGRYGAPRCGSARRVGRAGIAAGRSACSQPRGTALANVVAALGEWSLRRDQRAGRLSLRPGASGNAVAKIWCTCPDMSRPGSISTLLRVRLAQDLVGELPKRLLHAGPAPGSTQRVVTPRKSQHTNRAPGQSRQGAESSRPREAVRARPPPAARPGFVRRAGCWQRTLAGDLPADGRHRDGRIDGRACASSRTIRP